MKFLRYRRPSLNTLLGITKAKKRLNRELGITEAMKPFRWWTNIKRRFKRKIGYESEAGRLIRNGLPRPGGCLVVVVVLGTAMTVAAAVLAGGAAITRPKTSGKRATAESLLGAPALWTHWRVRADECSACREWMGWRKIGEMREWGILGTCESRQGDRGVDVSGVAP